MLKPKSADAGANPANTNAICGAQSIRELCGTVLYMTDVDELMFEFGNFIPIETAFGTR